MWIGCGKPSSKCEQPCQTLRSVPPSSLGIPVKPKSEFQALLDLIEELKLDHAGAFPFSFEPGTASEALGDPIPAEIKQERLERLMLLQEKISMVNNQGMVGRDIGYPG